MLFESVKKMYCIALIFFAWVAPVKSSSLIGRNEQMDDSFAYVESILYESLLTSWVIRGDDSVVFENKKT